MNVFSQFHNDTVFVEDTDRSRFGPFKTTLGSKGGHSASIYETELDIVEGWKLYRVLPSGSEEVYTIFEANFSNGLGPIGPHWQLKLHKESALASPKQRPSQVFNISNSSGVQIGDHNVLHLAASLKGLIEQVDTAEATPAEKSAAKSAVRQLLESPVVAGILGPAATALFALLK